MIYLDNTSTVFPKPECVYLAADEFYRHYGGNAGRGGSPMARKAGQILEETRALVAEWLGAPSPDNIIFAPSASISLNIAIQGVALQAGHVVYATPFEHNSVLRPIENLRRKTGIVVREIPFDRSTYSCQLDKLEAMFLEERPSLVCITQASNVCGTMPPVVDIAKLARQINQNCIVIVDGAQAAGLFQLPMKSGLIDALIFAGHKSLYGPYGAAGLVVPGKWKPSHVLFGGTGTNSESLTMPDDMPSSYEIGSPNIWSIAGLKASVEWLREKGRDAIISHAMQYAGMLREELRKLPGIKIYTPPDGKPWWSTLSFNVGELKPQITESILGAKDICVRAGIHCAPWAHRFLGTLESGGTVRVSTSSFTSAYDIESFIEVLKRSI
jgi:cysteine desulfurase family protein